MITRLTSFVMMFCVLVFSTSSFALDQNYKNKGVKDIEKQPISQADYDAKIKKADSLMTIGTVVTVVGGALFASGVGVLAYGLTSDKRSMTITGAILVPVGAVVGIAGIPIMISAGGKKSNIKRTYYISPTVDPKNNQAGLGVSGSF